MEDQPTLEELAAILDRADTEEVAGALAVALQGAWAGQVATALSTADEALEGGATVQEAIGTMRRSLSTGMRRQSQPQVELSVELLYRIGQREAGTPGLGAQATPTISFEEDFTTFWVENHYDRFVQDRIRSVSEQNFRDGLGAFRSGRNFAESRLGQEFGKSQSYWELLANSTATRTRELSHIDGFAERGIEEVFIDAVLDARTSCICRTLDETRFAVEDLIEWKQEMLEASDPVQIKETVSPWLPCETIQRLEAQGPEALLRRNIVSPPFHGHCRSRLSIPV